MSTLTEIKAIASAEGAVVLRRYEGDDQLRGRQAEAPTQRLLQIGFQLRTTSMLHIAFADVLTRKHTGPSITTIVCLQLGTRLI